MWELYDVTDIKYLHNYVYWIQFENGVNGEVSFEEYLGSGVIFEPFKDLSFFQGAKIEGGTISWSNGADIAPETLYRKVLEQENNIVK